MKIKKLKFIFLFVFILFHSESKFGQTNYSFYHPLAKSLLISLEGGSNYSFTDYESTDLGFSFGGSIEYFFPSESRNVFGLKVNVAKEYFQGNTNNLGLKIPADIFDTESSNIGFGFIYSYAINSELLPYASIGASYLMFGFESENIQSSYLDLKNGGEKSSLVYNIGAGLKYKINDIFYINVGLGYNFIQNDNIDAVKFGDYEDFYLSGLIGVSYRVWNEKDTDKDGISDDVDKCIYEAEDFDGYQDDDGCPDNDNDGDGISDLADNCPNKAEDFDGYQDNDGCPDPDNDSDGILDADDECPNLKEDMDDFEDEDGCPDVDNDGDGILDVNDDCVNERENFNGYLDDDGCPDTLPEPVVKEITPKEEVPKPKPRPPEPRKPVDNAPNELLILSETTFAPNSSSIKNSAYGELNRIVEELKKYPNTSWRIEGHIDKQSSRGDATRITKSQADAILSYFVSKGLSAANFQAVGFGDTNPIASNSSVYGKMKNRRIVIRKLD